MNGSFLSSTLDQLSTSPLRRYQSTVMFTISNSSIKTTPIAAPSPTILVWNTERNINTDGTSVVVPGPPRVVTKTTSKFRSAAVMVNISATVISRRSAGRGH